MSIVVWVGSAAITHAGNMTNPNPKSQSRPVRDSTDPSARESITERAKSMGAVYYSYSRGMSNLMCIPSATMHDRICYK